MNKDGSMRPGAGPLRAVSLRYDRKRNAAPRVTAKGDGELARSILAIARAHDVPVQENPDLVALLGACDLGEEIPVELYHAVAELLAHLYRMNAELEPPVPGSLATGETDA
jgi:flagellar biosynthesis protein